MMHLTKDEIFELINSIEGEEINYERIRPRNKGEIRISESKSKSEFKKFVALAIEDEHQPGGDIELLIPSLNKTLIGHHDGIYWLE